jgi:hypothetical protein
MAKSSNELPETLMTQIADAIRSLRYGAIHITVQDSHVVQIEKVEKIRVQQRQDADLIAGGVLNTIGRTDRTTGGSRTRDDR